MQASSVRAAAAFVAVVCLSSISFAQEMPRGSFLLSPAQSRYQLVEQVRVDPEVSMRYQRHFGMTQEEVVHYFSTLRTTTLTEPRTYTVWYTRPGRDVYYSKRLRLRKGEPVFVDQSSRVVLRLKCGNPMITREVARQYYDVHVRPTVETTTIETERPVVETTIVQTERPVVETTTTTTVIEQRAQPMAATRIDLQPIIRTHSLTWEDAAAAYVIADAMNIAPEAVIAMRTTDLADTRFVDLAPALVMSWYAKKPVTEIWTHYLGGLNWVDLATRYELPTSYWNSSMASTTGWGNQDFTTHFWQSLLMSNLAVPSTEFTYYTTANLPLDQWLVASVVSRQFNIPARDVITAYSAANNNWDTVVANFSANPPIRD